MRTPEIIDCIKEVLLEYQFATLNDKGLGAVFIPSACLKTRNAPNKATATVPANRSGETILSKISAGMYCESHKLSSTQGRAGNNEPLFHRTNVQNLLRKEKDTVRKNTR